MQQDPRRSNPERSEASRGALLAAARGLFLERSYPLTGTPEIVAAAGLTRGALYHHFTDKRALFRAVVEAESAAVAEEIEQASTPDLSPSEALLTGGAAFLKAMRRPGRTRLLLLDGPAVLGRAEMDAIDSRHGTRALRAGLAFAMRSGAVRSLPLEPLTAQLSAAFDRAALAIEAGAAPEEHLAALAALVEGLLARR